MNAVAQLDGAIPVGNGYHGGIANRRDPHLNAAVIEEATSHCHNCGAAVDYHFCAVCGQETKLHVPSAHEFLHEFITHYVALEGKLWQSLWLLLRKPGWLTAEYLAGRRARYIQPLRLYLTFSILFFALFKWGGYDVMSVDEEPPSATRQAAAGKQAAAGSAATVLAAKPEKTDFDVQMEKQLHSWNPKWAAKVEKFDAMSPEERQRVYRTAFFNYAPYAMFCLMPVFALYLKLLYLGTRRRYGEHLLFALHANAFAFLVVGLITALSFGPLQALMSAWLMLYLPFAMQRVYGGNKWLNVLRWLVLGALHVLSMIVAILAAFALAVVS